MKCSVWFVLPLAFGFFVASCTTKEQDPIRFYSGKEFTLDPKEKLYVKNGNLICASQRLALSSTQLVTRQVNGIPESVDLDLSRFTCEKPDGSDDICRVSIYERMNVLTDLVNRQLKQIEQQRQDLKDEFHQTYGDSARASAHFFAELEDKERKIGYQMLDQDKNLKREAQQQRRDYEHQIDALEEMLYGCKY